MRNSIIHYLQSVDCIHLRLHFAAIKQLCMRYAVWLGCALISMRECV